MRLLCIFLLLVATAAAIEEEAIPEPDIMPDPETTENANAGEDLFQGDIELGDSSEEGVRFKESPPEDDLANFSVLAEKAKEMALAAMKDYRRWTCVQHVQRSDEADYIEIHRGDSGCSATIGRKGGRQSLKLSDNCYSTKGTPSHEMMHGLGFYHEQARSDRDQYVKIVMENVKSESSHNFDLCPDTKCTLPNAGYDYNSVMHYSAHAFSNNNEDTIIPLDHVNGAEIGKRNGLSAMDIKKVNQMYDCGDLTSESHAGLTIPQEELNDKPSWTSCPTYRQFCGSPLGDYKYLKNCQKTCDGATKDSAYNKFNNCEELVSNDRSYCDRKPDSCPYSCNGQQW